MPASRPCSLGGCELAAGKGGKGEAYSMELSQLVEPSGAGLGSDSGILGRVGLVGCEMGDGDGDGEGLR